MLLILLQLIGGEVSEINNLASIRTANSKAIESLCFVEPSNWLSHVQLFVASACVSSQLCFYDTYK